MAILKLTDNNRYLSDVSVHLESLNMDAVHTKHHHRIATAPVMPMDRHRPRSKSFLINPNYLHSL